MINNRVDSLKAKWLRLWHIMSNNCLHYNTDSFTIFYPLSSSSTGLCLYAPFAVQLLTSLDSLTMKATDNKYVLWHGPSSVV
jgi:hypothetical protein